MKSKISALIDGELGSHELEGVVAALRSDPEAIDTWRTYHLVADAMRNTRPLSEGFSERVARRLAQEPIVVAPRRLASKPSHARWVALSAAASFAAVALVGWVAFAPGPGEGGVTGDRATIAQAQQRAVANTNANSMQRPEVAKAAARAKAKPLPGSARDYLLAHQAYSPRATVQGITPHVQTVADTAAGRDAR